jgi:hypothetical protein
MLPIARIYASVLVLLLLVNNTSSFASSAKAVSSGKLDDGGAAGLSFTTGAEQPLGDILILDHLNINHEQGRHDWLKAFYFDFLGCVVDPRKEENLLKGRKTLWANIGAQQFHLPEGKDAQVLEGVVTLAFPDISAIVEKCEVVKELLKGSKFKMQRATDRLIVTDPWGSRFHLVRGQYRDERGEQDGGTSAGLALQDLTFYTPPRSNIAGIARFYQHVLNAPILQVNDYCCVVSVGPLQTLTFELHPEGRAVVHDDLFDEQIDGPEGTPFFLSNYGPHVSMYIKDLPAAYHKAEKLGVVYVNPRFKRRAYTLEEAIDDCMFRCLDIVDPEQPEAGVILKLEHEIRSVVKRDGSMYKSCPFHEIPDGCKTL